MTWEEGRHFKVRCHLTLPQDFILIVASTSDVSFNWPLPMRVSEQSRHVEGFKFKNTYWPTFSQLLTFVSIGQVNSVVTQSSSPLNRGKSDLLTWYWWCQEVEVNEVCILKLDIHILKSKHILHLQSCSTNINKQKAQINRVGKLEKGFSCW